MTKCAAITDGWMAGGSVNNTATKPVDYTITVFFTTKTATVLDTAQTHISVPSGKTRAWTAEKTFTTVPGLGLLCVLRGVS